MHMMPHIVPYASTVYLCTLCMWVGWAEQVSELCFACLVGAQRTLQHNDNVKNEPNTWLVKTLQYVLSTF